MREDNFLAEDGNPLTEQGWLAGTNPQVMADFVRDRCSSRQLLLFRCALLRRRLARASPTPPAYALDRETADVLERLTS